MSDNGELEPVLPKGMTDGRQYHDGFPPPVFQRARVLLLQSGTYAHAYRTLKAELEAKKELAPSFNTIMRWGHTDKDVMALMEAREKGGPGETFQAVADDYAEAMVEARPHLSYSQIPVAFGIAADKPIAWAKVGQAGTVQAVQFNVTVGGKNAED